MREYKHNSTNLLSVLLALAEMGKTNPMHATRLCEVVIERVPGLVDRLGEVNNDLRKFGATCFNLPESATKPPANIAEAPVQNPPVAVESNLPA